MTAPDLRPSDDPSAAATMETGPEHQLAHQMVGELCKLCGVPWSEACWRAACPKAKPLAKVLPAGGPLLPGHPADKTPVWRCEGCGLLSTTERRPTCLQSRTFGCPMVKS